MNAADFVCDIPRRLALASHVGTSFVPEKRAQQEIDAYSEQLAGDYADLLKLADTPEKMALLDEEFARYREGYRRHTIKALSSQSRCVSWMIAGPSNFPAHRMEKRAEIAHRRMVERMEFRPRALAAIRKALCPELRPIMAGDDDAVSRLRAKIAEAENLQETMKTANAAIRKHAKEGTEAQVAALVAMGHPEAIACKLLVPDWGGRIGYPDYALTNNNANIRRMKQRLASIERTRAIPATHAEGETGVRLEDIPAENRVRLYFPGKPAAEIRASLKSWGFRWTPSLGCWQAYRNSRSIAHARQAAGLETKTVQEGVLQGGGETA